jgi:hypothetical protein
MFVEIEELEKRLADRNLYRTIGRVYDNLQNVPFSHPKSADVANASLSLCDSIIVINQIFHTRYSFSEYKQLNTPRYRSCINALKEISDLGFRI